MTNLKIRDELFPLFITNLYKNRLILKLYLSI